MTATSTTFPVGASAGLHLRHTTGAAMSPDATSFAHIVDGGGYPRAVQRFLNGRHVSSARWVQLPVDGPVTAVRYSPDGAWLACQVAPEAGTRTEVWVVTNDPTDTAAWSLAQPGDASAELVGWAGAQVAVNALDDEGWSISRLVDPATRSATTLDHRPLARLLDAWAGSALVRRGPRDYRDVLIRLAEGRTCPLLPDDHGSTTDQAVIVDPARAAAVTGEERPWPSSGGEGPIRVLARSDVEAEFPRLVDIRIEGGRSTYRVLASRPGAGLDEFCVSDDATTAALLFNVRGRSELEVIDLRSGATRDITLPGLVASQLSISATGSLMALTVEGPGMPPSVELVDARTGRWNPVEPARLEIDRFHTPTRHTYTARDGTVLSGWLHHPPGESGPGPTVVYFHGGPEAEERPGHSYLFPDLTRAGFTVFTPNVRGSSGRGRTFQHADEGPKRVDGINDVADTVDYLVAAGLAERGRIGVTGRSYGGYLTYAALTCFPERFAAGVAICGMSDLQSFYERTEPWIAAAAVSKYGDPETDADLLASLSPIHRIDRLSAPLMVVHGAHDTNVPVSESQQIVDAVRSRGGVAEFLLFDDEGHEIVTQENQARLAAAMVTWFRQHL